MGGEGRLYTGYGNDGKREKASFSPPTSRIKYMGLKIRLMCMREQDMHVHLSPSHSASPFFFVPKNFSGACVNKRGSSKGLSNPVIPSQGFAQSCDLNGYFRHSAPYACFQSSRISPPSCFKILACITGTL